jgi:hypothetical protein
MHPRHKGKPFNCCDQIGSYQCCADKTEVSPMAQEIGIGATMFLLANKSLALLFLALTVINIPVYAFYYYSNPI